MSDLSHWLIRAGKDQQQVKSAACAEIDAAEEAVVPKQQNLQVTGIKHLLEGRIVQTTEQSSVTIRDDDSSKFSEVEEEDNEQRQSVRKGEMKICSDQ